MTYTKQLQEAAQLDNEEQNKALALAMHLELEPEQDETLDDFLYQLSSTQAMPDTFEIHGAEYLVLTDEEADDRWDEHLDEYIDQIILPELPEAYKNYFDDETWKKDAKMDGRGYSLSSYDGNEYEQDVNGTTYYIYRTN